MSVQNLALSWFLRKRMQKMGRGPIDVDFVRAQVGKMWWLSTRVPTGWRIRDIAAAQDRVAAEIIEIASPRLRETLSRTVLYLHGGGYFFCSPQTHRAVTCGLARSGMTDVMAPDYRLAPEHRAPMALHDAVAAYRQLLAEGRAPGSIVVAGDSAGGGLALALLMMLRDAGDPMPAAAVLFSPWTDLAATGSTLLSLAERDVLFDADSVRAAAALYLGDMAPQDWRASPLYGDFSGLPPLLIQASDSEILLDDARRAADKARAAGVDVTFTITKGVPHAWQMYAPLLPEAKRAIREAGAFIRRHARTLA